jgi:hypothetical protein
MEYGVRRTMSVPHSKRSMVNPIHKPVTTQTSISPRTSDLTMDEQLQWFERSTYLAV